MIGKITSLSPRVLLAVVVLIVASAAALHWVARYYSVSVSVDGGAIVRKASEGPTPVNSKTEASGPSTPWTHDWQPAIRQSYRVLLASDVALELGPAANTSLISQLISGVLHMRIYGLEPNRVRLGFQLEVDSYTLNNQPNEPIAQGLGAPFLAWFEPTGRPVRFEFPPALKREGRVILEELIRTFQIVLNERNRASRSWTAAESHATGRYLAYYSVQPDGSVRKSKTMYTLVDYPIRATRGAGEAAILLKQSANRFVRSPGSAWISSGSVDENLVITVDGRSVSRATVRGVLSLLPGAPSTGVSLFEKSDPAALLASYVDESAIPPGPEAAERAQQRAGELVVQLDKRPTNRIGLRRELEQILSDHPEITRQVADAVLDPDVLDDTKATLINALGRVGHLEAQNGLLALSNTSGAGIRNRLRSLVALGDVEATDSTIDKLIDTSNGGGGLRNDQMISNTALLALGATGSTLQDSKVDRAGRIRDELTSELYAATNSEQKGLILKAMANMADRELVSVIHSMIDDSSPFVRASAARALGRSGDDIAIGRLIERMPVEENATVRAALVDALQLVEQPSVESLKMVGKLVGEEPEARTRYAMAKYIGENLRSYPEGLEALQYLALQDRSNRVRRYAASVAYGQGQE